MKTQLLNDLMLLLQQQFDSANESGSGQTFDVSSDCSMDSNEVDTDIGAVVSIKPSNYASTRVFTEFERIRFTKASYQFLVRLGRLEFLPMDYLEMVINHLLLSDAKVITLSDTKWYIRHFISDELSEQQLAFLDLVLYQKEDNISIQ